MKIELEQVVESCVDDLVKVQIDQCASEIKSLLRRSAENLFEIAAKLKTAQALLKHNKSGGFEGWVLQEFGWSDRTAYSMIAVHDTFSANSEIISRLEISPTTLYLLASPSTPPGARDEAVKLALSGKKLEVKETKALIDNYKEPKAGKKAVKNDTKPNADNKPEPEFDRIEEDKNLKAGFGAALKAAKAKEDAAATAEQDSPAASPWTANNVSTAVHLSESMIRRGWSISQSGEGWIAQCSGIGGTHPQPSAPLAADDAGHRQWLHENGFVLERLTVYRAKRDGEATQFYDLLDLRGLRNEAERYLL